MQKCPKDGTELRISGWHPPHPQAYCVVCGESFWEHNVMDGEVKVGTTFKNFPPFKWGMKSKDKLFEKHNYPWVKKEPA